MLHVTQMAQEYQELVIFQVLLVEKDIIQNNFKLFARQRPTDDKKSWKHDRIFGIILENS